MIKKIVVFALSFVLSMSCFLGCALEQGEKSFNIKVVPATEKYKLTDTIIKFSQSADISLAANEYEAAQIIITPDFNVSDLDISVSDLVCGSEKISKENIEIFWEHYVFIGTNDIQSGETTGFTQGHYPDALVPFNLRKEAKENKVKAGQNQGIWISVKSDETTKVGIYSGKVTLKSGEFVREVALNAKVYDFALPRENHFLTAFAIWDGMPKDMLFDAYQSSDPAIAENYYEFMLDYRVSPTHIPSMSKLTLDEQISDFISNIQRQEVGSLALPYTVTTTQIGFNTSNMKAILSALADLAKTDSSVLDKAYVYFTFIDEPVPSQYARVKLVNQTFNNLLIEVAAEKFSSAGMESVKAKFLNIPCVNTTHLSQDKIDAGLVTDGNNVGIDTWCPTFDYFNSEKYRLDMQDRKTAGDGVWWYGCVNPRNPFPTLSVNDHLMPQRFVAWMQMQYGVEGQLFWATNAYKQYSYEKLDYIYRDVWNDAVAFPSAPGDGYLTYPGYKYGLNSPIPTIRLDNFRAGQEDYEYLYMLRTLYESKKPFNKSFNDYVSNLYKQLYQGVIARNDSDVFALVREELAALIELAQKDIFVDFNVNQINNNCKVTIIAGSSLSAVSVNDKPVNLSGGKYESSFIITDSINFATVKVTVSGKNYTLNRFVGGKISSYSNFDEEGQLDKITVSKSNRLGIDDVKASLSTAQFKSGKSLKVDYIFPGKQVLGYLPTVTVSNYNKIDFSRSEIFNADIYNESERDLELMIMLVDKDGKSQTLYKAYLQKNSWNNVNILAYNADINLLDLANITEIKLMVETLSSEDDNMTLYFDNVYVSSKGAGK